MLSDDEALARSTTVILADELENTHPKLYAAIIIITIKAGALGNSYPFQWVTNPPLHRNSSEAYAAIFKGVISSVKPLAIRLTHI